MIGSLMNIIDNISIGIKNSNYIPDDGLMMAMDAALILKQPLLITGEPGVGKTEFANFIASCMMLPEPLVFECKSTTESKDIFYQYDAIGRLQAKEFGNDINPIKYINFNALGLAIIKSNSKNKFLSVNNEFAVTRSIVLIDEIDKAPYDFPNDILTEIDKLYFKIPEFNNIKVETDQSNSPIIIITSNSEKNLSKAFLRRCIYYPIPFPKREKIEEILSRKIGIDTADQLASKSIDLFYQIRGANLNKNPTTAELISWFNYIKVKKINSGNYMSNSNLLISGLGILVKNKEDFEITRDIYSKIFL